MPTIKHISEKHFVEQIAQLAVYSRDYRFWDNYCKINSGEYGKTQRQIYMEKVKKALKMLGFTAVEIKATMDEILLVKNI